MKRITISVDSDVDLKFRKKASQKYQFEKGWYSSALEEAMVSWSEDQTCKKFNPNQELCTERTYKSGIMEKS